MIVLTPKQKEAVDAEGHLLVTGGPGSGKTTVSILRAGRIVRTNLKPGQSVLFLSFARATVSRVLEAIAEDDAISVADRRRIEVETYHSFFWRILKTHGYLLGLPRRLSLLTPSDEAIVLSSLRSEYKADSKLSGALKAEKNKREQAERIRLAQVEGRVCFDLFAPYSGALLTRSAKIRRLVSTAYPFVILDEFQDTNLEQWNIVRALGEHSSLMALADPEQRIYDFIGADPARIGQFSSTFKPTVFDLSTDNHRSRGTDITKFGNDILRGTFPSVPYSGVSVLVYEPNAAQAYAALASQTLAARKRLQKTNSVWSLAILVPTKAMTRMVSDAFIEPPAGMPTIGHSAVFDVEGAVLSAEIIAFLMEPGDAPRHFEQFIDLVCGFFRGKGGDSPTKGSMSEARSIEAAMRKSIALELAGKSLPGTSILLPIRSVYGQVRNISQSGDPDSDWISIRRVLGNGACPRMTEIAKEARNIRLLDRGTQFRQALAQDWRTFGAYRNALAITRQSFVQEHFATSQKPETGIVVMNMHKAKGKQFDEVIIFEGWPIKRRGQPPVNLNRIVRNNLRTGDLGQARQNFRVSVTRAKSRTTILTPKGDPCVLLTR